NPRHLWAFGESSPAGHNQPMCGRYRQSRRKQIIAEHFDAISDAEDWIPRYNVAPTQHVPVIRQNPTEPTRHLSQMRWGLIPSWSKDASGGASMINARSEIAATLPAFHSRHSRWKESERLVPRAKALGCRGDRGLYHGLPRMPSFTRRRKVRLLQGKLADMVLLSDDIFTIAPEKISDVRVLRTFVGGRIV